MLMNNRRIASMLCFFGFLLFYGITSRADIQLTDEVAVFTSAISLGAQGNLSIDELQWLNDNINIGDVGEDGHFYSKYFPGNVITAAIVYNLAKIQVDQPYLWLVPKDVDPVMGAVELAASNTGARAALKINALLGALAMTALFLLLSRHFDWRTAIITVLFVGVCSDWWYQSRGFLSEVGAGALLIISLYFADTPKPHPSGLAFGLSLLFRPTNLIAFPIWIKSLLGSGWKSLWSVWGIIAGGIGLLLFNWIRFGSFLNFGYGDERFLPHLLDGLYGVLLSPGRSIFLYSPILTLAIPGAWWIYKKEKSLTLAVAITAVFYILMAASWHSWDGGWSWGSRLLTPIVPILGFLAAPAIDSAWGRPADFAVVLILGVLGFGIQLMTLATNPLDVLVDAVVFGGVTYNESINSIGNSWLALQLQSLNDWQFCDLDAYTIRQWLGVCDY